MVLGGTRPSMASRQAPSSMGRWRAAAPSRATLEQRGLPALRARSSASTSEARPSPRESSMPWGSAGIFAMPDSTLMGSITCMLETRCPSGASSGRFRMDSSTSRERMTSAPRAPLTMEVTRSPKRTVVETEPPLCAMPWISETFTSKPESMAARASRSAARMVPWPPTPHSMTQVGTWVFDMGITPLPWRSRQTGSTARTGRNRCTWSGRSGRARPARGC